MGISNEIITRYSKRECDEANGDAMKQTGMHYSKRECIIANGNAL